MGEEKYLGWVGEGRWVDAKYATGDGVHGSGRVYGYTAEPTLMIERPDGTRFSWIARLCELSEVPPSERKGGVSPATVGGASAPDVRQTVLRRGRSYGEEAIQAMVPAIRRVAQRHGRSDLELNWYDMAANAFNAVWSYCEQAESECPHTYFPGPKSVCPVCNPEDPRDAEIARLRDRVSQLRQQVLDQMNQQRDHAEGRSRRYSEVRDRIYRALGEEPPAVLGLWADLVKQVDRLCDRFAAEVEELETQRDNALDANAGLAKERDRFAAGERSLCEELAAVADLVGVSVQSPGSVRAAVEKYLFELDQRRGERDDAREEWKRADAEVTRLRKLLADVRPHVASLARTIGMSVSEPGAFEQWIAERDLGGDADAAATCGAGNEDYPELRCKRANGHRDDHEDPDQGATWSREVAKPAEPRRWVAGDDEPGIGTKVRRDTYQFTRHLYGWHRDGICGFTPDKCPNRGGSWVWMTSTGRPLYEVVSIDG